MTNLDINTMFSVTNQFNYYTMYNSFPDGNRYLACSFVLCAIRHIDMKDNDLHVVDSELWVEGDRKIPVFRSNSEVKELRIVP